MSDSPLIVITGSTASGKTGLATELAEKYNGEIICADSRTIYKGMDIGTAKPTSEERERVPHYLLDVVEPGDRYTAADFQRDAFRAIEQIRSRERTPFLVGGTGLYIDAVVREYEWPEQVESDSLRANLEGHSIQQLQLMIKEQQLELPVNLMNKRHLITTLTRNGQGKARLSPRENTHVVAIATEKKGLEDRIHNRAEKMFENGVIEETTQLAEQYGWDNEAMKSNIYPIIRRVIDGEITQQQAIDLFIIKDRQLAKRQITWLKRHDYVHWLPLDQARSYIETILS